jgi:nucleoside-diphosphate-sugar epimerase
MHGLGWRHRIGLKEGVRMTYDWYLSNPVTLNRG